MITQLLQIVENKSVVNNIVKIWKEKDGENKRKNAIVMNIDNYLLDEDRITQDERELVIEFLLDY